MVDPAESFISIGNEDIFRLDRPEYIKDIKGLADRHTINILQILNSEIEDRHFNSWWSTGAIRQLTFIDRTNVVENILMPFVRLGIIDVLKISELPSYSINKRGVHGLITFTGNQINRKKYRKDGFCYKLRSKAIDLIFRDDIKRSLFVPLENLHLENVKFLRLLLRRRAMLILRAFEHEESLQKDDFINYLNSHYNRTDEKELIKNYDLSALYKLGKQGFRINNSSKIYSEPPLTENECFIIKREILGVDNQKQVKNKLISYILNFDRIQFLFTNQMGKRFKENNNSFQKHYPDLKYIQSTIEPKDVLYDDVTTNGIIVDVQ
ncbi:MAG: hypothetical protein GPJ54_06220 [Candidatus Heimdallarchaeota archaeon]|nr:hypothetical protein [Candidatus Heimdallarchaeota archaeon]